MAKRRGSRKTGAPVVEDERPKVVAKRGRGKKSPQITVRHMQRRDIGAVWDFLKVSFRDVSTEKPSEVGAVPETAAAISGKVYTFPGNGLGLKSLSLTLVGPQPRIDLEFYDRDPTGPSRKVGGPIGLDGRYQKGDVAPAGLSAAKGSWSNDHTFVLNRMILGAGFPEQKYTLWFDGDNVNVHGRDRNDRDVSVDGGSWKP